MRRRGLARATERNRGIDPKRLLKTMHKAPFRGLLGRFSQVGIGPEAPELPLRSEAVRANSRDAALRAPEVQFMGFGARISSEKAWISRFTAAFGVWNEPPSFVRKLRMLLEKRQQCIEQVKHPRDASRGH